MQKLIFLLIFITTVLCNAKFYKPNRTNFPGFFLNTTAKFEWNLKHFKKSLLTPEQIGKICLKNIDKCIKEDLNYETTTNPLANFILSRSPPIDYNQIDGISNQCKKQTAQFSNDLKQFKLWALKMYDASAKLPSGILNGNVNQLGDFDLCLQAIEEKYDIRGKYCLASMQIESETTSPYVLALHKLVHSHYHYKSELDDPGHRVPRFTNINWALCIPHQCQPNDLEIALKTTIEQITNNTDLKFKILVRPEMCQSSEKQPIPISTIIATLVFAAFFGWIFFATLYDTSNAPKKEWILAFSLKKNWQSLKTLKKGQDDLEAVHGIRCINAVLLLLAHKSMAMFFTPYVNRTEMIEFVSKPWTVIGRAASLYTDPFILISGTLTSFSLLNKLQKTGRINLREEYISRLFRIVPTFASLIAFCTLILPWLNAGPMWNQVITHHSEICKKYWWRNLLFIHNYFGFEDMCLTHTHHVGIDTQLFFISPFLVYLIYKWPRKGGLILVTLAIFSTVLRYYVTYTMELSNYIHFGTSIKQLFATADNMYILPIHRLTVYIMGIILGYFLRYYSGAPLSKRQLRIATFVGSISAFVAFFGPAFMSSIDYVYKPTDAAWYAAFSPILWSLSFALAIYTTHTGVRDAFQRFFSWPYFAYWTKISYPVYLIQFPVFFYNIGITRAAQQYGFFSILLNLQEQVWIYFLAILMTLLVEMPFQNLRNLIFRKPVRIQQIEEKKID